MNKNIAIKAGFGAFAASLSIALMMIIKRLAFIGMGVELNFVQSASFPLLGIMLGTAAALTILFHGKKTDNEKSMYIPIGYTDYFAWIFFSLSLAALVSSPLASESYYIGYAMLFAVVSACFFIVRCLRITAVYAENSNSKNVMITAAVLGFVFAVIPVFGLFFSVCGLMLSVSGLRREEFAKNLCTGVIAACSAAILISVVLSVIIVYFLL